MTPSNTPSLYPQRRTETQRLLVTLLFAGLLGSLVGCSDDAADEPLDTSPECRQNEDCPTGQVCLNRNDPNAARCDTPPTNGSDTFDNDGNVLEVSGPNTGCPRLDGTSRECPSGLSCCEPSCVDTTNDANNCGGCGVVCAANEACQDSVCVCIDTRSDPAVVDDCSMLEGRGRCCTQAVPGEETSTNLCFDVASDPSHCGACGTTCATADATRNVVAEVCSGGTCGCADGNGNTPACNADESCCSDGCTELDTDPANCGGCGIACGDGESCVAGQCVCGELSAAGIPACAVGELCCGDARAAADQPDALRCRPAADPLCICNGAPCTGGQLCCDNACTDINTDGTHCGGCGNVCTNVNLCSNGQCTLACDLQTSIACPRYDRATNTRSDTATDCVDPLNNINHCGAASAQRELDVNGNPTMNFDPNTGQCNSDMPSDPNYFGVICPNRNGTAICNMGTCELTCDPGFADCIPDGALCQTNPSDPSCGCETALNTIDNCGRCGQRCDQLPGIDTATCDDTDADGIGTCLITACVTGRANCTTPMVGEANDGCETDGNTSPAFCGAGNLCSSTDSQSTDYQGVDCDALIQTAGTPPNGTAACAAGQCTIACSNDFLNCDNTLDNGCEVNSADDEANCGGCNIACVTPIEECQMGMCTQILCSANGTEAYCGGFGAGRPAANCVDGQTNVNYCGAAAIQAGPTGGLCDAAQASNPASPDYPGVDCDALILSSGMTPNGTATCTAGQCGIACTAGFLNCDNNLANGCEVMGAMCP